MTLVYADTIRLKNGRDLEGLIRKERGDAVEIDVGNGTVVFHLNEIEQIERSTPQEIEEIKKGWELSRARDEKTKARDQEEREKAAKKWDMMAEEEWRQGMERRFMEDHAVIVPATTDEGHIIVQAVLNEEVPISFIVDTGCPFVLLTARMAGKLGLDPGQPPQVTEIMVLNGKHKVRSVLLKSVKLGEAEEKNVPAMALLEDGREIKQHLKGGLLGMSFLKRFDVTFDQKKTRLILKPRLES